MVPKFRIWDKESETMVYQEDNGENYAWQIGTDSIWVDRLYEENDSTQQVLMQSTGLKDKNGVEIFEGDVLTSNVQPCKMVNPIKDGYGVVRFENGMFKLGAISLVTFISKMEVIGNIYENPELLEQAHEI